jgi:hypothetical protein
MVKGGQTQKQAGSAKKDSATTGMSMIRSAREMLRRQRRGADAEAAR